MSRGVFSIGSHDFEVIRAAFEPFFGEDAEDEDFLAIGVEIEAESDAFFWNAGLRCEVLRKYFPGEIRSLVNMGSVSGSWNSAESESHEVNGYFVGLEHEPIRQCDWRFYQRKSAKLMLEVNGSVDLRYDRESGLFGDVRIRVRTELEPPCIWCGGETETQARGNLNRYGIEDEFDYLIENDGVAKMIPCR